MANYIQECIDKFQLTFCESSKLNLTMKIKICAKIDHDQLFYNDQNCQT